MLVVAPLAVGLMGGSIPVLGVAALVWFTGRAGWTREFSGWRRVMALIVGPLLLALTTVWPSPSRPSSRASSPP